MVNSKNPIHNPCWVYGELKTLMSYCLNIFRNSHPIQHIQPFPTFPTSWEPQLPSSYVKIAIDKKNVIADVAI